jgi:hypothetical protein
MATKICICCKKELDTSNFTIARARKDGLDKYCKVCKKSKEHGYTKQQRNEIVRASNYRIGYHLKWAQRSRYGHTKKGVIFNFSDIDLSKKAHDTPNCVMCGKPFVWDFGRGHVRHDSPTLDNTDLNCNPTIDQVQIICMKCNVTKQNRTMSEFVQYCSDIATKYKDMLALRS